LDCKDPAVVCPNGYKCDTTFDPAVCVFKSAGGGDCNLFDTDAATPEQPEGIYTQPCAGDAVCTCGDASCDLPNIDGKDNSKKGTCIRTIQLDCEQIGCPAGYACLAGVCKTEITTIADCKVIGCPRDYECTGLGVCLKTEEKTITKTITKYIEVVVEKKAVMPLKEIITEIPYWVYAIILLLVGLIVYLTVSKKVRK